MSNRIFGLLRNKIVKNCSLPASCFLDTADKTEQAMRKLVDLSLAGSTADPALHKRVLQCNAECLSLYFRSLQHVVLADPARLSEARAIVERVLQPVLADFEKKHSHINSSFFELLFTRTPLLCMTLIPQLGKVILSEEESKIKNYKRLEFVGLLRYLLRSVNSVPTKDGVERVKEFMEVLEQVFEWAKERVDNRQKEGYEDFRKLPRRRLLNEYCRLVDVIKAGGKKKKKNEESKQKVKGAEQEEKEEPGKKVAEKKEVSKKKETVMKKNVPGKSGKGKIQSIQKVNRKGTRWIVC